MTDTITTSQTIETQARRLGYAVEREVAGTGTVYLTLSHVKFCDCKDPACGGECADRLLRIGDHEANEARYAFHVNRKPDLDIDAGYQVAAVHRLAEWIGVPGASVPYIRRAATLAHRALIKKIEIVDARRAESEARVAESQQQYETASEEDRAKADHYATLHGKARKRYGSRYAAALRRAGARS